MLFVAVLLLKHVLTSGLTSEPFSVECSRLEVRYVTVASYGNQHYYQSMYYYNLNTSIMTFDEGCTDFAHGSLVSALAHFWRIWPNPAPAIFLPDFRIWQITTVKLWCMRTVYCEK